MLHTKRSNFTTATRRNRAPLVAGQPEQREYRAQAYVNNARTGPLSAIVSVVTVL